MCKNIAACKEEDCKKENRFLHCEIFTLNKTIVAGKRNYENEGIINCSFDHERKIEFAVPNRKIGFIFILFLLRK